MSQFDRYISKFFWSHFFAGLVIFLTIFLAVDALSTMVSYRDVSTDVLFRYYFNYLPELITKMVPIACLLGTILALTVLNKNNELVALFSSGMSLARISSPLLMWVLAICMVNYFIGDRLVPALTKQKNYIFYNEIKKTPGLFSVVKTNRIWYRSKNSIFNIKTLNVQGTRAQGLTLYFFDDAWDLMQMMTAEEVDMSVRSKWTLKNGSVTVFSSESSFPLTSNFDTKTIQMSEDSTDLQNSGQTSETLTQKELAKFIDKNKDAGLETVRYEVDYHSKISFSFAGLVMSLLGIPFSVGRSRAGGMMLNVGICIGLVFGYWILYSSSLTLGNHGHLPAFAAAWLPNIFVSGLGIYLIKRQRL